MNTPCWATMAANEYDRELCDYDSLMSAIDKESQSILTLSVSEFMDLLPPEKLDLIESIIEAMAEKQLNDWAEYMADY